MKRNNAVGAAPADQIIGAALFAFGQGAGTARMIPPAVESFRGQFSPKVSMAVECPGWRAAWQREQRYVLAYAEAMGQRAAALAAEAGRPFITHQDVSVAVERLRGYMPIAGRWCPL